MYIFIAVSLHAYYEKNMFFNNYENCLFQRTSSAGPVKIVLDLQTVT